ncbi:DUF3040 domain-containing protein [Jatrophihabitans fulvus]
MPLSEHEQKLLDQIEQALYAEDPKFAASVRSARAKSRTRRSVLLSALGVVLGLGLVLVGLVVPVIVLSVVGFVLVVASCALAVQAIRGRSQTPDTPEGAIRGSGAQQKQQNGGLRNRMEDRLRRRFEEN